MTDTHTVTFGDARVVVDLPLHVMTEDGIRIETDCGKEVAMWSEDELNQIQVKEVAAKAIKLARNEPEKLLDKMAHHVVGTSEVSV